MKSESPDEKPDGKSSSNLAERKKNYQTTIDAVKQWQEAEKIKDELVKQLTEGS